MKILQVLPMAVLLIVLGSCKKQERAMEEAPVASSAAAPEPARDSVAENQAPDQAQGLAQDASKAAPATAPAQNRAPAVTRKLIRTGNLQLEVRDTEEVAARVQALATRLGGFVGSSNGQRREDLMYYNLTLRVPVERLDEAVAAIRALAIRVNQEHQQVDDVTDQYIDLDARMRTLEATETELRALLAESRQRARKVSEIMEVYQQLIEIRSQIEQIRTQLNSFDKLAALSTINLELMPTEAAKPVVDGDEWRPGDTLRGSARTLMGFLRWLLDAVIYFFIVLLPVGLVIAVVVLALRWVWRRLRRKEVP
jgi:uncharacterized protein DUF4349